MSDSVFVSKLGISFSASTIDLMERLKAHVPKHENNFILWFVMRDENDRIKMILGANPTLDSCSIEDEVNGFKFYWVGEEEDVDDIRDKYCLEYDRDKNELRLPPKEP